MKNEPIKVIAFDLDGTLTQHKSPLSRKNRVLLDRLARRYRLVIVDAGACARIHRQMGGYPIDIIGQYGMQSALLNKREGTLNFSREACQAVDREAIRARVMALRQQFGWTQYLGEPVECHLSGVLTFPILGTDAALYDRRTLDPSRAMRGEAYAAVLDAFEEYTVYMVGGDSFDIVPRPYGKLYALEKYCRLHDIDLGEAAYAGDEYGLGGHGADVQHSAVTFIPVDDSGRIAEIVHDHLR